MNLSDNSTHDVIEQLRELLHGFLALSIPAWIDLQLTMPQLRVIFIVAHKGSASVMEVARHLGIGEPTASHLIDRLVRSDLLERAEDPADRRRAIIRLSPYGEETIAKLLGWEDLLSGLLQRISSDDLAHFSQGLHAIVYELYSQASIDRQPSINDGAEAKPSC